jgi:hypothetical protein
VVVLHRQPVAIPALAWVLLGQSPYVRSHGGTEGAKKELRRIFERGLELLQETTEHFDQGGLE